MSAPLVFVSGPLTTGEFPVWENVRRALAAGDLLFELGAVPIVPHLAVQWATVTQAGSDRPYDDWMGWCYAQIMRCEALYRVPGKSTGADLEVGYAKGLGKPVFECRVDMQKWVYAWAPCATQCTSQHSPWKLVQRVIKERDDALDALAEARDRLKLLTL